MSATRPVSFVRSSPDDTSDFFGNKNRWRLYTRPPHDPAPDGHAADVGWECISPFGSVRSVVVVDDDGQPVFDRPEYREAPNVNVVAYGIENDGTVKMAVITQPRPHADDPRLEPGEPCDPVVFGQIVMGFNTRKLFGDDVVDQFETPEEAACRETGEESGAQVILGIERPSCPWHNPNPTFVATWSDLLFVQVDLKALDAIKSERGEPIYQAEFIDVPTLLKRIAAGIGPNGEYYRMCTANSAWFVFFCYHPELFMA